MAEVKAAEIAWLAVYPAIGIARLGNAEGEDDFTIATERIGGSPDRRGGYRASDGRIKRQAVRFRIYAKLRSGDFVELIDNDSVKIEWRVEIANLKAGWYQFNQAMDLSEDLVVSARRRNAEVGRRVRLDIRPGQRRIAGRNVTGPQYRFDDGQFVQRFVYLGEVRTDDAGRLLFLGGRGVSAPIRTGMRPVTFANNDRWHDDVADGPIRAWVTVEGRAFEADPGYVVVAPPNYAPGLPGVVTMDDTVRETFISAGWLPKPTATSFSRDVWPIFDRLTGLQWINHGLFVAHGAGSPLDARQPNVVARLADASVANRAWRQRVFALFRDPSLSGPLDRLKVPYIYGDLFGEKDDAAGAMLSVTPTMYAHLGRWAAGSFDSDWAGFPQALDFETLAPSDQVEHLTRCGLTECLGGPFHPGIELSWPLRRRELWALNGMAHFDERFLYRLNLVPENTAVRQDFGTELTRSVCLGPGGPIEAAGPGALTRWMGVPWQTDEASCNSSAEYSPSTYLSMPSYWGARVPDQVLSTEAWSRAIDGADGPHDGLAALQRLKHVLYREDWLRDVRGLDYYDRIERMVRLWATLGILEPNASPAELMALGLPTEVHVETGRHPDNAGEDQKPQLVAAIERLAVEAEPSMAELEAGPAAAKRYAPPRHTFRQGEV